MMTATVERHAKVRFAQVSILLDLNNAEECLSGLFFVGAMLVGTAK